MGSFLDKVIIFWSSRSDFFAEFLGENNHEYFERSSLKSAVTRR